MASAEMVRGLDIDFVAIGNAGNLGDTRTGAEGPGQPFANPYGCGAVGYNYRIGKYEVTNAQWNSFVDASGAPTGDEGIYNYSSQFTDPQQPVTNVNHYEAMQFCNYLTTGDKSKGAYRFSGTNDNPGSFMGVDRIAAKTTYGTIYVLPTEDEWYKAAYFKPDGSGYSNYANGTSIAPIGGIDTCYDQIYPYIGPWQVGSGTQEQNGTFDIMGNVWERTETFFYFYGQGRSGYRGGSYTDEDSLLLPSFRIDNNPGYEFGSLGFRVVSIPEPCGFFLFVVGGLLIRKQKMRYF
jgi:formylglycine-generating enzyme required for sulfatase activity